MPEEAGTTGDGHQTLSGVRRYSGVGSWEQRKEGFAAAVPFSPQARGGHADASVVVSGNVSVRAGLEMRNPGVKDGAGDH